MHEKTWITMICNLEGGQVQLHQERGGGALFPMNRRDHSPLAFRMAQLFTCTKEAFLVILSSPPLEKCARD
jgi:hypothetical protein